MPFRHLHLCFIPPRWDAEDAPRPANTRFVRHTGRELPGARLPDWFAELPDRPTVFASLGTVFNKTPGVLEAIVEGLAEEPVNVIVAIGRGQDPRRFGRQAANVRLEAYVPQPALLAHSDLFITHGGFNSVKEALSKGMPMVVIPITSDQPYSAKRCVALGVAEAIDPGGRSPDAIRAAARKVLADRSYRANARRFQAEMAALPGLEEVVKLLEALDRRTHGLTPATVASLSERARDRQGMSSLGRQAPVFLRTRLSRAIQLLTGPGSGPSSNQTPAQLRRSTLLPMRPSEASRMNRPIPLLDSVPVSAVSDNDRMGVCGRHTACETAAVSSPGRAA